MAVIDARKIFRRRWLQRWRAEEQSKIYPKLDRIVERLTAQHDIADVAIVLRSYGANLVDEVRRSRGCE
jgi:hypothetical protein